MKTIDTEVLRRQRTIVVTNVIYNLKNGLSTVIYAERVIYLFQKISFLELFFQKKPIN